MASAIPQAGACTGDGKGRVEKGARKMREKRKENTCY